LSRKPGCRRAAFGLAAFGKKGTRVRALPTTIAIALSLAQSASAADAARRTVELEVNGQRIEGTPLSNSKAGVELLGRDGRLWTFSPQAARELKQTGSSFQSLPVSVLKGQLQAELGKNFRIVSTGHYLVALPEGVKTNWAERFEELYRSFSLYFSVRGFQVREPEFPLIAIVWPDQASFMRASAADRGNAPAGVLGYYSPISNRIMLYDMGNGHGDAEDWRRTSATIIHEATHQTAFNTGIHQRFSETPRWLVEGLGMLFEAPGVWNSRANTRREDRINRGRFDYFRKRIVPNHKPELLQAIVSSDRLFSIDPQLAYAEAWALSFFLVETQPRKYSDYLALTARRPAGQAYPAAKRLSDFASIFGADFRMLEARFLRFMADLR
jgi:Protein of unknown function (DUF1570)